MPYKSQDYGIIPDTFESINVKFIAGGDTGVNTTLFYNGLTGAFTLGDSTAGITGELDTTGGLVKSAKLELTNDIKLNNNAGTSGQVLTSAGANAVPTWTTPTTPTPVYGNFKSTGGVQIAINSDYKIPIVELDANGISVSSNDITISSTGTYMVIGQATIHGDGGNLQAVHYQLRDNTNANIASAGITDNPASDVFGFLTINFSTVFEVSNTTKTYHLIIRPEGSANSNNNSFDSANVTLYKIN